MRMTAWMALLLTVGGCLGSPTPEDSGLMTSKEAFQKADSAARAWTSDAMLFSIVGVEHGPQAMVKQPPPHVAKADEGGREYPCGPMDEEAWAIMDPSWPGVLDEEVGDGRITAWQAVYFSWSKDQGTGFIVRAGKPVVCVADPLNAQDREDLKAVEQRAWSIDSAQAMTLLRGQDARLENALAASKNAQVSYGFDLRKEPTWGIKGTAQDQGVSSFYGVVDMTSSTVRSLDVR